MFLFGTSKRVNNSSRSDILCLFSKVYINASLYNEQITTAKSNHRDMLTDT